ncbi:Sc15 protein [Mycena venus]|uniref:Sc15 protein n=1 Tax=Mycena venus TaxID=2733690 RepID=A0A8H6XP81_9AGAR|nr:Sc15 protein [Mycena venus]
MTHTPSRSIKTQRLPFHLHRSLLSDPSNPLRRRPPHLLALSRTHFIMFTLRLASLFFLAIATFVAASPVAVLEPEPVPIATVEKRASISSIDGVLNTLQGKVGSILPQMETLVSTATVTEANVAPLVLELVLAIDTATTSLSFLRLGLKKRQSEQDVANLVAGIVSDVANMFNGVEGSAPSGSGSLPDLSGLLSTVDLALNSLLVSLDGLLAGVLTIVTGLLGVGDVTGILGSLGLTSVLGLLAL